MKKLSFALALTVALIAGQAYAAGTMSNVSQNINIEDATIVAKPKSAGGNGHAGWGQAGGSGGLEYGGGVTIGNIENKGNMSNVSQKIHAKGAQIHGEGASVTIGNIKNN